MSPLTTHLDQWLSLVFTIQETNKKNGWAPHPVVGVSGKPAGWSPHQRGWLDEACVTTQPQLRHELAWIVIVSWTDRSKSVDSRWLHALKSWNIRCLGWLVNFPTVYLLQSPGFKESVTPLWRQLHQLIWAPFRAMTYPVTLRRLSESAAKSLSTYPVKTFRFSAPGSQYDRPWSWVPRTYARARSAAAMWTGPGLCKNGLSWP